MNMLKVCGTKLQTKLHNILININYRSERQSHIYYSGADPGFQVRGAHLKKSRRAEGDGKHFGVFRVKNHDFTPKNHIFSNFRGGGAPGAPPLDPPLLLAIF